MSQTRTLSALAFTGAVIACSVFLAARTRHSAPGGESTRPVPEVADKPIPVRPDTEPYEPYRFLYTTDQSISVYRERCKRDPDDYASRTTLGTLYLRRARETGDAGDYDRAGDLFAESLKLFPKYGPAKVGRIAVMNAKHKFAEAKAAAEALLKEEPGDVELRVLVADADIELGEYDAADAILGNLAKQLGEPAPPAILARMARMRELRGQPDEAIELLKKAAGAERADEASKISLSWYSSRIGEIQFSQGKLDGASASLEMAIRDNPGSPGLKVILAKIRLAQGRAKESVAILDELLKTDRELESFVEKVAIPDQENTLKTSLASSQNFDTYLSLGEALSVAGKKERAAEAFRNADRKIDREEPIAVRELILSYCDRNHRLPRAHELAAKEAKARGDVYSCDSLAWASFKNGKLPEAEKAAADALRLGTRESIFYYHAGVIAHAMKKPDRAKELFEKSLQINPHFSVEHVAEINRLLAK